MFQTIGKKFVTHDEEDCVLGALLALVSASGFGFNNASARRGVLSGTVWQALAITVPLGVPVSVLAATMLGSLNKIFGFSLRDVLLFSFAGVIHFVWGRYCNYRAIKAMGAVLAGPVQQASVLVALALAIALLGETLTVLRALGIVLVILGPALILFSAKSKSPKSGQSANDAATQPKDPSTFKPKYFEGYAFALLSATGYGLSPVLVRLGAEHNGLAAAAAASVISYGAAALAFMLTLAWPGRLRHVLAVPSGAAKWFTLSGVVVGVSQLLRYMALAVAPVSIVTPIQRLSILFRIYFSALLNRQHEELNKAVVVGTIVSLVGALALTVSADTLVTLVPLPRVLIAVAHWHWP